MKSGDTVNFVRADNGKIGHSNFLWISFFDQGHSSDLFSISWILVLELVEIDMVNIIYEF